MLVCDWCSTVYCGPCCGLVVVVDDDVVVVVVVVVVVSRVVSRVVAVCSIIRYIANG